MSRYAGSYIVKYDSREFDAYELLTGAVSRQGPSSVDSLEGTVTEISYRNPDARSTLEVLRNYEDELTAAGFEILFTCANDDCGGRDFNHAVMAYQSVLPVSKWIPYSEILPVSEISRAMVSASTSTIPVSMTAPSITSS